jgi:hypothetical protein
MAGDRDEASMARRIELADDRLCTDPLRQVRQIHHQVPTLARHPFLSMFDEPDLTALIDGEGLGLRLGLPRDPAADASGEHSAQVIRQVLDDLGRQPGIGHQPNHHGSVRLLFVDHGHSFVVVTSLEERRRDSRGAVSSVGCFGLPGAPQGETAPRSATTVATAQGVAFWMPSERSGDRPWSDVIGSRDRGLGGRIRPTAQGGPIWLSLRG